jgi:hypothetical protein
MGEEGGHQRKQEVSMRIFIGTLVFALGVAGCASVPYEQSSQAPDWVEVVNIRKQELANARAAVEESCKRSARLTELAEQGVLLLARMTTVVDKKIRKELEVWVDGPKVLHVIDSAEKANAVCLASKEELEEEKARYEQLGRMLELAFPPSLDVDVYHHYY